MYQPEREIMPNPRNHNRLLSIGATVMLSLAVLACSPTSRTQTDFRTNADTSQLELQGEALPTLVFTRPGAPALASYSRFIVDTVAVNYGDRNIRELTNEEVARMQAYFRNAMIEELQDGGYVVGTRSDPGTMRISLTISGLSAAEGGGAANIAAIAGSVALGVPGVFAISVGEVTVEGVFREATTNRIDAVVVDRSQGSRVLNSSPWSTWADVEASFDKWAEGFREALDEAHGRG